MHETETINPKRTGTKVPTTRPGLWSVACSWFLLMYSVFFPILSFSLFIFFFSFWSDLAYINTPSRAVIHSQWSCSHIIYLNFVACVNFQCVVSFSGYLLGRDHLVLPMSHYIVHLAMTYFGSHNRTNLNFNITRASRHAPSRAVATVSQVTIFDTSRESNPSSHQRFQRWAHNLLMGIMQDTPELTKH